MSGTGASNASIPNATPNPMPGRSGASPPSQPAAGAPALGFDPRPPEKTGVVFEWPETDPSVPSNCRAGRYVGEYACRLYIITNEGDGAFDISGTIDMRLEASADGELLRIADGHFASATLAAIPVFADIVGELRCSSSRFEGRLENGTFSVALGLPIPFTEGTFSGDLSADYDPQTAALANGSWNMQGELDLFPGSCMDGTWSATWVED